MFFRKNKLIEKKENYKHDWIMMSDNDEEASWNMFCASENEHHLDIESKSRKNRSGTGKE